MKCPENYYNRNASDSASDAGDATRNHGENSRLERRKSMSDDGAQTEVGLPMMLAMLNHQLLDLSSLTAKGEHKIRRVKLPHATKSGILTAEDEARVLALRDSVLEPLSRILGSEFASATLPSGRELSKPRLLQDLAGAAYRLRRDLDQSLRVTEVATTAPLTDDDAQTMLGTLRSRLDAFYAQVLTVSDLIETGRAQNTYKSVKPPRETDETDLLIQGIINQPRQHPFVAMRETLAEVLSSVKSNDKRGLQISDEQRTTLRDSIREYSRTLPRPALFDPTGSGRFTGEPERQRSLSELTRSASAVYAVLTDLETAGAHGYQASQRSAATQRYQDRLHYFLSDLKNLDRGLNAMTNQDGTWQAE